MSGELFAGLMSGTSLDGVDAALVDFSAARPSLLGRASRPFDPTLRAELLALQQPGEDELHRAARCANALSRVYAGAVAELLSGARVQRIQEWAGAKKHPFWRPTFSGPMH